MESTLTSQTTDGNMGSTTRKFLRKAGYALVLLLLSRPAYAQDITVLVVAVVPPILLAPLCLTFARLFWLSRRPDPPVRFVPLLGVSCLEVLLWIAIITSVLVLLTGDSGILPLLALLAAIAAAWALSGIWFDRGQNVAHGFFFASPPLVLLLLLAVSWGVLIVLES